METKKLLDGKMKNLETLIETKTAGVMLRSKARWVAHGEKNTKYFLNLEKRNYNKKVITKLKKSDGTELTDPNHILREEENFYTNLYSPEISNFCKEELEEANIYFLSQQTSASLNPNEVQLCEGEISERECLENLKAMPNGKSPGTDGFPAEFLQSILDRSEGYSPILLRGCL